MMTFLLQPACEILLVTGMAEQGRTVSLRGMPGRGWGRGLGQGVHPSQGHPSP